jgi:hypothetical protein
LSETNENSGVKARSVNGDDTVFSDGAAIAVYRFARFLCALALLSLEGHQALFSGWSWSQVGLVAFYVSIAVCPMLLPNLSKPSLQVYVSLLALATLTLPVPQRDVTSRQIMLLLLSASLVYFYLDAWPYATYYLSPFDPPNEAVTWVRFGILVFAGVVTPMTMPRPFRPKGPGVCYVQTIQINCSVLSKVAGQATPSPEDTCSLLSSITYSFLDGLIFRAWRVPTIGVDDILVLPDESRSETLRARLMNVRFFHFSTIEWRSLLILGCSNWIRC